MMISRFLAWALVLGGVSSLAACSENTTAGDGDSGDGDTATTGGTSSGGSPSGGAPTTGGDSSTSGGAAGTGGAAPLPIVKSSGCGAAAPATGERTISINAEDEAFIVSLPSNYDPNTAYPLGFAFHGFGRTHAECRNGDCAGFQTVMGEEAVLVYMKSTGEGWEQNEVREQNVDFFETLLDTLIAEACIDESRIFVAGTSSGAHFTNVLACRFGDRLLAVAPVAGYLPESDGCVGRVAAVPIHGIDDPHVTFDSGETARDFYVERNNCTTTTVPDLAGVHQQIRNSRDAMMTDYACVDYQGCDADLPVRWCEHSEGGYDNSTHGWPTAGGQMIWDFVSQF